MDEIHYSIRQMSNYISNLEREMKINLRLIEAHYGSLENYIMVLNSLQMKQKEAFYHLKSNIEMLFPVTIDTVEFEIGKVFKKSNIERGDEKFYQNTIAKIDVFAKEIEQGGIVAINAIAKLEKQLIKDITKRINEVESLKQKLDLLHQQLFYHVI